MQWQRETQKERESRLKDWHQWFACHPVRLYEANENKNQLVETRRVVWFEKVMRKYLYNGVRKIHALPEDAMIQKLSNIADPGWVDPKKAMSIKQLFDSDDD